MTEPRGPGGAIAPAACAVARTVASSPPVPTPVSARGVPRDGDFAAGETCDYCGAEALAWRKCKLICGSCAQINKSCADL